MKRLIMILPLLMRIIVFSQGAQTAIEVPIGPSGLVTEQALLYKPSDYDRTPIKYPLLVFLHGKGESGTKLSRIYNNSSAGGPAYFIAQNNWPDSFAHPITGVFYKFIVVSPQADNGWSTPGASLEYIIKYLIKNYRVDISRIYLTGLSAGGSGIVEYAAHIGIIPTFKEAALVPMSAVIDPSYEQAEIIVTDSARAWGFGDPKDDVHGLHTEQLINYMNEVKNGFGRFTAYNGGHCCWNTFYDPEYIENVDGKPMNIYQWMLLYTREHDSMIINIPPIANAGIDITITLPVDSITLMGTGIDADGSIIDYNWTKITGPSQLDILNPDSSQTIVRNLVQGIYQFQLKVTDNSGATATDIVKVIVNADPNQLPVANAGNDITIPLPLDSVLLHGTVEGSVVSYSWTKVDGPAQFNILNPDFPQTTVNNLVLGVYQFEFKVTDSAGTTAADTVMVTVNGAPNLAPVANAGNDIIVTLPVNYVSLNGTATDEDGSIVSYSWTKIAGPAQFDILNPASAQTLVNNLVQGVYQFELNVTDNASEIATDTIIVTVNAPPNLPPVANAGNDIIITLPADSVSINGSGTDENDSVVSYSWTKIAGPSQINILNPNDAQTTIKDLVQGVYELELQVTDYNGAIGTDTVIVTVNAAPNLAPVANAGNDIIITLPVNNVSLNGTAIDTDGRIILFKWTKIFGPDQFTINDLNIPNPLVTNLVTGNYIFRLTVTDNMEVTAIDDVAVIVNPEPILLSTDFRIEAEAYSNMHGANTEYTSDIDGGLELNWISSGNWMDYNVNIPIAGTYTISFRIATSLFSCGFNIKKSDGTLLTTVNLPNTGSFQNWVTIRTTIALPAGKQRIRIESTNPGIWNFNWMEFEFGGSSHSIPGRVQAEDYSTMGGIQIETTKDSLGGFNVGSIDNGDWLNYDINVASSGPYTLNLRLATSLTGARFEIRNSYGTILSKINIPNTGGYQNWQTVSTNILLDTGIQQLKIVSTSKFIWNFNWMDFHPGSSISSATIIPIVDNTYKIGLKVFPNPAHNNFVLQINNTYTGKMKVRIMDINGAVKKEFDFIKPQMDSMQATLSVDNLSRGTYMVQVQIGGWNMTTKLIKL